LSGAVKDWPNELATSDDLLARAAKKIQTIAGVPPMLYREDKETFLGNDVNDFDRDASSRSTPSSRTSFPGPLTRMWHWDTDWGADLSIQRQITRRNGIRRREPVSVPGHTPCTDAHKACSRTECVQVTVLPIDHTSWQRRQRKTPSRSEKISLRPARIVAGVRVRTRRGPRRWWFLFGMRLVPRVGGLLRSCGVPRRYVFARV
jgi:hypothetical protein